NTVKLAPGSYVANLTIANKSVRILGTGSTVTAGSAATGFEINDGADVTIVGAKITNLNTGNPGTAIDCRTVASGPTAKLSLQQVTIDAMGNGLFAYPCTVTMAETTSKLRDPSRYQIYAIAPSVVNIDRSSFDVGDGLAAVGAGGVISVRNSIISNMNVTGTESALIGGSFLGNSSVGTATATFTTFVNAPLRCAASGTPSCIAGGVSVGVCVHDSVLLTTNGADVATGAAGAACQAYYSIAMPQNAPLTGASNLVNVDPKLVDVANHNFALSSTSPAIDAAEAQPDDPFDFLGVARPQGAASDMGAFEYKP
ncbi:MAG: choice-of-anchor Q domain-containing protein, partial [Deltaproteobacteria bacterium]